MVNRMMPSVPELSSINSSGVLDESEQELRENGWMRDLIKCASSLSLPYWRQEVNRMHEDTIESEEKKVYPRFHLEMMDSLDEAAAARAKNSGGNIGSNNSLLRTGRNGRRMRPNMFSSGVLLPTQMPMSSEIGDVMSQDEQYVGELQEERGESSLCTSQMALNPSDITGLDSISCILLRRSESDSRESDLMLRSTTCDCGCDLPVKNEMGRERMEDERHGEHEQLGSFKEEEEATNHVLVVNSPSLRISSRLKVFLVSLPGLAVIVTPIVSLCLLIATLCARDLQVPPRRVLTFRPTPSSSATTGKQNNYWNQYEGSLADGTRHLPIDRWGNTGEDEHEKSSEQKQAVDHHLVVEAGNQKSQSQLASTLEATEIIIPTLMEWRDSVLQSFDAPSPNQLAVTEGAVILERLLEMEKELLKPNKRWWRCHIETLRPVVPSSPVPLSTKNSCAVDPPQYSDVNLQQHHHFQDVHSSLEASLAAMAKKMTWFRDRSTIAEFERLDYLNVCGAAAGLNIQDGVAATHNRRYYWCSRSNHTDRMRILPTTLGMHNAV